MIIGAGGSLGNSICDLLDKKNYNVIAVDNDENSVSCLCKIYSISEDKIFIEDVRNFNKLKVIIEYYDIDIVVNCAALKHVMWCESNMRHAIEVNILANLELMNYLSKNDKKFIYVSSDKAINPKNVYALTKQFTDYIVQHYKFKLVRGVNFINSNGSVLDMWNRQRICEKPFTVVKDNKCNRYFISLFEMAAIVKKAIDDDKDIVEYMPSVIYKIYIKDLFNAYLAMYNICDYEVKEIILPKNEKLTEDLNFNPEVIELKDIKEIINLLRK